VKKCANLIFPLRLKGIQIAYKSFCEGIKMKVINLIEFKAKKKTKTWLYSLSFHDLFNEFFAAYHNLENHPENYEVSLWLDTVSEALDERFFNSEKIPVQNNQK